MSVVDLAQRREHRRRDHLQRIAQGHRIIGPVLTDGAWRSGCWCGWDSVPCSGSLMAEQEHALHTLTVLHAEDRDLDGAGDARFPDFPRKAGSAVTTPNPGRLRPAARPVNTLHLIPGGAA